MLDAKTRMSNNTAGKCLSGKNTTRIEPLAKGSLLIDAKKMSWIDGQFLVYLKTFILKVVQDWNLDFDFSDYLLWNMMFEDSGTAKSD